MTNLTVIIPTFNERENIGLVLWILHEHLTAFYSSADSTAQSRKQPAQQKGKVLSWEVVVVDDGSPDGTADVVRRLQRSGHKVGKNVKLVERPGKLGLGTAYMAGVEQVRVVRVVAQRRRQEQGRV